MSLKPQVKQHCTVGAHFVYVSYYDYLLPGSAELKTSGLLSHSIVMSFLLRVSYIYAGCLLKSIIKCKWRTCGFVYRSERTLCGCADRCHPWDDQVDRTWLETTSWRLERKESEEFGFGSMDFVIFLLHQAPPRKKKKGFHIVLP